jgi:hypothetical protein
MADQKAWLAGISAAFVFAAAQAQDPETAPATGEALGEATAETFAPIAGPNPDEMADQLNAQQQIQQSFTVTRTINGEVVETEKRTVTYDRNNPYRETEAGQSAMEALKAAFDREVLTRTEAFEEAKLDFTAGDKDRDGVLSEGEFIELASEWRVDATREAAPGDPETARERQYRAFLDELNPEASKEELAARAKQKFLFMAGAAGALSREDYVREYLLDFDSMDRNRDMLLKANELMEFRAANRGEAISAQ